MEGVCKTLLVLLAYLELQLTKVSVKSKFSTGQLSGVEKRYKSDPYTNKTVKSNGPVFNILKNCLILRGCSIETSKPTKKTKGSQWKDNVHTFHLISIKANGEEVLRDILTEFGH